MANETNTDGTIDIIPIPFHPSGPAGFTQIREKLPFARLVQGIPIGADYVYFERNEADLIAGIWRSEPYEEYYEHYPSDEFMVMLSGEVTVGNNQRESTFKAGDAFLIPKGFRGFWRQKTIVEKYYIIVGTSSVTGTRNDG